MVEREERPRLALRGNAGVGFHLEEANVCEGGKMMEIVKEKSGALNVLRRERDAQEEIKDILLVEMEVDGWRNRRKEKGNCLEWSLEFSCIVRAIDCKWGGENRAKEVKKTAFEIDTPAGGVGWRNVVLVRAGAISVNVERRKEWIRRRGELKSLEGKRFILEFGQKSPVWGLGGVVWAGKRMEAGAKRIGESGSGDGAMGDERGQGEYVAKEGAVLVATEHMIKDGIGIQRGMCWRRRVSGNFEVGDKFGGRVRSHRGDHTHVIVLEEICHESKIGGR
eukprot:s122_g36.t1